MTPTPGQKKAGWFKGKPENSPITQKTGHGEPDRHLARFPAQGEGGNCRFWRAQL